MGGSVRTLSAGGQDSPTGRPEAARRASARDGASQSRPSVQIEEPTSGSVILLQGVCQPPGRRNPPSAGARKNGLLRYLAECRPANPIPSASLISADRGDAPRAASPLSLTAYYAKKREYCDINNQLPITDSTVYCDLTWIPASSCQVGTVNLLYRSSGTGRCHRTLPGLRNLSDIAHRLDIVLKN